MNVFCIVSDDFVTFKETKNVEFKKVEEYEESMKKYDSAIGTHFFKTYQSIDNTMLKNQYIKYYTLYTLGGCFIDSPLLDYNVIEKLYTYCIGRGIQLFQCKDLTIATTTHIAELDNILRDVKPYVTIDHADEHCTKIVLTVLYASDYYTMISKEMTLNTRLSNLENSVSECKKMLEGNFEAESENREFRKEVSGIILPGILFLVGMKITQVFVTLLASIRNS